MNISKSRVVHANDPKVEELSQQLAVWVSAYFKNHVCAEGSEAALDDLAEDVAKRARELIVEKLATKIAKKVSAVIEHNSTDPISAEIVEKLRQGFDDVDPDFGNPEKK